MLSRMSGSNLCLLWCIVARKDMSVKSGGLDCELGSLACPQGSQNFYADT